MLRILKGIIFDYDGVIVDSFKDQFEWFKKICKRTGKDFPYKTIEEFRENYVEPIYPDMYVKLGFEWNSEKQEILRLYDEHKKKAKIELVKDIDKVIKKLAQDYKLGIASSNYRSIILKDLISKKLNHFFSAFVTSEDLETKDGEPKLKPNPDSIIIALKKLCIEAEEAVYVGDQLCDVIASLRVAETKKRCVHPILVSYGYASGEKLRESIDKGYISEEYIANTPQDLVDIIKKLDKELE